MRDLAVLQAGAGCYSQAALSSNDSKTLVTLKRGRLLTLSSRRLNDDPLGEEDSLIYLFYFSLMY